MNRRQLLRVGGASLVSLAGCLGQGNSPPMDGHDLPSDSDPTDGYPPAFETTAKYTPSADDSFQIIKVSGEQIPLAPIETVYTWYTRQQARIANARGTTQYRKSHIYGAVHSPAAMIEGSGKSDPVSSWPKDARIVCYCGCPHHISSRRAATLRSNGYTNVYVLDEGFWEWHDRKYPMAGTDTNRTPASYRITGRTTPQSAGDLAIAVHESSGQREEAPISSDGTYSLELHFHGVSLDSLVTVQVPSYHVTAPLSTLTTKHVTASLSN